MVKAPAPEVASSMKLSVQTITRLLLVQGKKKKKDCLTQKSQNTDVLFHWQNRKGSGPGALATALFD